MKKIVRSICFALIGVVIFLQIQKIVTPKREAEVDDPTRWEAIAPNTIDVAFLGSSHVYMGVSPMEIYASSGITSYVLGSNGQPLAVSYLYLEEFFKKQSPSVVFLDVSAAFRNPDSDTDTIAWKYVFDFAPSGSFEHKLLKAYAQDVPLTNEYATSVIFPLYEYHVRWKELTTDDFAQYPCSMPYTAGFLIDSTVQGTNFSSEFINEETSAIKDLKDSAIIQYENGITDKEYLDEDVYVEELKDSNVKWIDKIHALCKAHEAQLILTKIPVLYTPQYYASAWTDEKSRLISELALEKDIPYLNLSYGEDVGLNFKTDTGDNGKHLNIRGAMKISQLLSELLQTEYTVTSEPHRQYDQALEIYQKVRDVALLQSETDFVEYLNLLIENSDSWDVLLSACVGYAASLDEEMWQGLENLGCELALEGDVYSSYLAIFSNGQRRYEALSGRQLEYETELNNNEIAMISSNWRTSSYSSVRINGEEFSTGAQGLNIVVVDNETNQVIDSVAFDTQVHAGSATRNWDSISNLLAEYSDAIETQMAAQED